MKERLRLICIAVVVAALCISFYLWRNKAAADLIDFNTITKVEIMDPGHYSYYHCYTVLTEKEDIKEFTDILDSIKLKKSSPNDVDGGVDLDIYIYHDNNKNEVEVRPERLWIDEKCYKCDMSYCEDILELYYRFLKHSREEEYSKEEE